MEDAMDSLPEELFRQKLQDDELILRFVGTEPVTQPDGEALAYRLGMDSVYITCNEDNIASRKTIESLGAEYLGKECVDTSSPYLCYHPKNARVKRRYRWSPNRSRDPEDE